MGSKKNTCGLCGKHISNGRVYCKKCSKLTRSQERDVWKGYV